jgi:ribose transport system permease protein
VGWLRVIAFGVSGLLSGFAGILLAGSLGSVDPSSAPQFLLQPYAGVFVGTAMFQLGKINIPGAMVGLYFIAIINTALGLAGASVWITDVFSGCALLAGIVFARFARRPGGVES